MTVEVQGPDGNIYEFPDSMSQDAIRSVMAQRFPPTQQQPQQQALAAAPQPQAENRVGAFAIAPEQPKAQWTNIPPANSGYQVEGTGLLPFGRYKMPDGTEQVSYGLPQPLLNAYRTMRYALGIEQDPEAPPGQVSDNAMLRGAVEGAGIGMTGTVPSVAARGVRAGLVSGSRLSERAARLNQTPRAPQLVVPKAMDPNPTFGSQAAAITAQRTTGLPFVGAPTRKAAVQGADALRERLNFATGLGAAIRPDPAQVGRAVKARADKYVGRESKDIVSNMYTEAEKYIPKDFKGDLPNLTALYKKFQAEQAESTSNVRQPVIDAIEAAIRRGKLTVKGAEDLKQSLSRLGKPGLAVGEAATAAPHFKRAAQALNKDLAAMIKTAGGPQAEAALRKAKDQFVLTSRMRRAAERFVGKKLGDDAVAGETVIGKIYTAAGTGTGSDTASLYRMKKIVGDGEWRDVGRVIHARMARGSDGEDNILQWAKNFNKLSPGGRQAIFGNNARELTDLAKFATDYMRTFNAMGNPSKSGDLAAIMAGAAALTTQPIAALLTGSKILTVSKIMAQPRKVKALKTVLRLSRNQSLNRAQQNMLRASILALTTDKTTRQPAQPASTE